MMALSNRTIRPANHPLRLLLYLEWSLLAIALLGEVLALRFPGIPRPFPPGVRPGPALIGGALVNIVCIVGFGLMGLRLPVGKLSTRMGFVLLEVGLIGLVSWGSLREMRLFSLLYVVLVLRSCLMFALPGRLVTTGLAYGLFVLMLVRRLAEFADRIPLGARDRLRPPVWGFAISSALLLGLTLLFLLLLVNALLTERESRQQLATANAQLRNYALRVEKLAMAQERNRIAREIHDSLGHSLTALNLQLEGALKLWQGDPQRAYQFLQEAKRLGSTALKDVRQSVAAMRVAPLQQQSLAAAIAELAQTVQQATGVWPSCQVDLDRALAPEMATSLYRIVQEAFTNICKYARPSQVRLDLQDRSGAVHLVIQDDGVGFDPHQNQTGFGLQSMRERAEALGGTFAVRTSPGQGCTLTAHIPLDH